MNKIQIFAFCCSVAVGAFASHAYAQIRASETAGESTMRAAESHMHYVDEAIAEASDMSASVVQKEETMLHPWKDKLSFELNLNKLRSFIIATRAVRKINQEWDLLIAGAKDDELAVEYQDRLAEESARAVGEVPGITLEEYEALYSLSLKDASFSALLKALNDHIYGQNK